MSQNESNQRNCLSDKAFILFDGCCEPRNPGGHLGYGAAIYDANKECLAKLSGYKEMHPENSNNVAEYLALLLAFEFCIKEHIASIDVYGDSMLVVNQLTGKWKATRGKLYYPFYEQAKANLKNFTETKFTWIPRDKNEICDKLSKCELIQRNIRFMIQPQ